MPKIRMFQRRPPTLNLLKPKDFDTSKPMSIADVVKQEHDRAVATQEPDAPVIEDVHPTVTEEVSTDIPAVYEDAPSEDISCGRESLDNSDIVELLSHQSEQQSTPIESGSFICSLSQFERARYTINLTNQKDVKMVLSEFSSDCNVIVPSPYIDSKTVGKFSMVLVNLMNKDISFTVNYIAYF